MNNDSKKLAALYEDVELPENNPHQAKRVIKKMVDPKDGDRGVINQNLYMISIPEEGLEPGDIFSKTQIDEMVYIYKKQGDIVVWREDMGWWEEEGGGASFEKDSKWIQWPV